MRFSEWQLGRLRDALRAYHRYERSHDGSSFTWKDVCEAIDEYTAVRIPPERLRQFVEGINTDEGGRKFPVPKDDRLSAIYNFAVNEEVGLLSEDEVNEFRPSHQAALRLLEYLDQDFDEERIVPPDSVEGTFRMTRVIDYQFAVSEITLERPVESGLIEVRHTEDFYEDRLRFDFAKLSLQEKNQLRESRVKYGGWAILTPEDNLFFFLKNERNGANRYYFTLGSDLTHGGEAGLSQLFLLDHDYPLETAYMNETTEQIGADISERASQNIFAFTRVT